MEQKKKGNISATIILLAVLGFDSPLFWLLVTFMIISGIADVNLQENARKIIIGFSIYSVYHISIPFILEKFDRRRNKKPSLFNVLLKWLIVGMYFSFLGAFISILQSDMNYVYAGVFTSIVIAFFVITYIEIPIKIDKKDPQTKFVMFTGISNLISGIGFIYISTLSSLIKDSDNFASTFAGIFKYLGISFVGLGVGILYILFILLKKKQENPDFEV